MLFDDDTAQKKECHCAIEYVFSLISNLVFFVYYSIVLWKNKNGISLFYVFISIVKN